MSNLYETKMGNNAPKLAHSQNLFKLQVSVTMQGHFKAFLENEI